MAAAAFLAAGMVSCVKETAVYDAGAAEIGFTPVSYHITKGLPGPMDGTVYDGNETFGIFAWHKITAQPQSWQDFYNDGTPGAGVTYIDGEPFAKNPTSKYWAGGYNELSILVDRVEDASVPGGKKRETVTTVDVASNVHDPHYWPKTGYLAFAGYSPYYRLEITKVPGEDGKMDLEYDASTMLSSGDCNVSYVPDGAAPYLKIENFTQGDYEWGEDDHWATNETCDLMWFDADDQVLEVFRPLKVLELRHHLPDRLAAPDHHICHLKRSRLDLLYVVHVDPEHDILYLICDIIDILAQGYNILTLDRRKELLCQMVQHIMLLHIRAVLDLMEPVQPLLESLCTEILQRPFEHLRRAAGILRARDKIIKIK